MDTRNCDKIFLIDHVESQIVGAKLPSNGQVLKVLFYNLRKVKLDLRSSSNLVLKEIEVFWEKARIPTRKFQRGIEKVEALYGEWKALQKSSNRNTDLQKKKEKIFIDKFDDLFDIAHAEAMNMISIEGDRQFLFSQRQKGRVGCLIGRDNLTYEKEKKMLLRKQQEETRKNRCEMDQAMQGM